MAHTTHLAVDLGASSCRVVAGTFDGERVELKVVARYPNGFRWSVGAQRWDFTELWAGIRSGIQKAMDAGPVHSIGVDSWAVDYGLLDDSGNLMGDPVAYRDCRTDGVMEHVFGVIGKERLYDRTGIQFLPFNSLYQWKVDPKLIIAGKLLMIPDLVHYWLCGSKASERTNASTTQALDADTGDWSQELLEALGIRSECLPRIVEPGTVLGTTFPLWGWGEIPVVAPGTHDTASAFLGTPIRGPGSAILSSGTWSLLGIETMAPNRSKAALDANFTNEYGCFRTWRFLKNVMGLWIVQNLAREWGLSNAEAMSFAEREREDAVIFDVDDPSLLAPSSMVSALDLLIGPRTQAVYLKSVLGSLAVRYAEVVRSIERITGQAVGHLHIVGGGSENRLLNQLTANAVGCRVEAGPTEATALGNILMQLKGLGRISSLEEARMVGRKSVQTVIFEPQGDRGGR